MVCLDELPVLLGQASEFRDNDVLGTWCDSENLPTINFDLPHAPATREEEDPPIKCRRQHAELTGFLDNVAGLPACRAPRASILARTLVLGRASESRRTSFVLQGQPE